MCKLPRPYRFQPSTTRGRCRAVTTSGAVTNGVHEHHLTECTHDDLVPAVVVDVADVAASDDVVLVAATQAYRIIEAAFHDVPVHDGGASGGDDDQIEVDSVLVRSGVIDLRVDEQLRHQAVERAAVECSHHLAASHVH